ncbi:Loki-CTERM sorting domain-containing protein [Candidatus Lokiarchaeum ossiferum]|uniref:Loki-CTERM sorting domain-containing protein n=1 Tax=Candidatus Lokiarchaeum ossiferum TaxID=2951803 RepID=UPI00352D9A2E
MLLKNKIIRLSIFVLMLSSFYLGTELLLGKNASSMSPLSSADDNYEENNSYDQAYVIEKGELNEGEDAFYSAILQDTDWYVIDLVEGENLSILILIYDVVMENVVDDIEVHFYSDDHVTQVGGINRGQDIIQIYIESAPSTGSYYICLNPTSSMNTEYQMIVWPYMEDKYEENDEISSAAEIFENSLNIFEGNEGFLYALDDDWYKVYLEPDWSMTCLIWYLTCAEIQIEVIGPDQTTPITVDFQHEEESYSNMNQFTLSEIFVETSGYYYIHVQLLQGNSLYQMELEIEGNPLQVPFFQPIIPNPDDDGHVRLYWSYDNDVSFYTVYRDSSEIVDITSLTPIANNFHNNQYYDTISENGTFYYVVTAHSESETTPPSNCESVEVQILPFSERQPVLNSINWREDDYGRVRLYWSEVFGADYYLVYRDTVEIVDYSELESVALIEPYNEDQTSFYWSDNLEENGTYYYAIVGVQGEDRSNVSNCEYVVINIIPFSERVSNYVHIYPTYSEDGSVEINWDNVMEATSYYLYRDDAPISDVSGLEPITIQSYTSYNERLTDNGTYYYCVVPYNGIEFGKLSVCQSVEVVILPFVERCPTLKNLNWNDDDYGRVSLSWKGVYEADFYLIYRDTIEIVDYSNLESTALVQHYDEDDTSFSFVDILEENGTYYYAVIGVQDEEHSLMSNCENVTVTIIPFSERSSNYFDVYPSNSEDGDVSIQWDYVMDAQSYYLYRDTKDIGDYSLLDPIARVQPNYRDEMYFYWYDTLEENGTYYYCVVPFNGVEFGQPSICDSVEVNIIPFTEKTPQLYSIYWDEKDYEGIQLAWKSVEGANQYLIYRNTTEISSIVGMEPVGFSENSRFTDYVPANGSYYYVILASDGFHTSRISNCESVTVNIIPFQQRIIEYLDVSPRVSDTGEVRLEWMSLHGATSYSIYREMLEITDISTLTPIHTSYEDTYWYDHLPANGTYWYAVIANNGSVDSNLSYSKSVEVAIIPFSEREIYYLHGSTGLNQEGVYLNWNDVYSAISYDIYRSTSEITDLSGLSIYATTNNNNWGENIPYNSTYYYVVKAYNGSISTPISPCVMIEQIFLPFYELESYFFNIRSYEDGRVQLNWDEIEETNIYEIYRDTSEITDISEMIPIHTSYGYWDTSFNDYVEESGLYYYVVVGNNGTTYSKISPSRAVYVNIIPFHERTPYLRSYFKSSTGEVRLEWETFYDAEMYYVYRLNFQQEGIDGLSPITMTPNNYYDEILTTNDTFYYVVVGYDGTQLSRVSNCRRVPSEILPFSQRTPYLNYVNFIPSNGEVQMRWESVLGAMGYHIYRHSEPILSVAGLEPVGFKNDNGEDSSMYYYDSPEVEGHYYYAVVAYDGTQMSQPSNSRDINAYEYDFIQRKPYFYISSTQNSKGMVNLNIENIKGAKTFYIFRESWEITSTSGLEPIAEIGANSIFGVTYTDIVPDNGKYYYVVVANNGTINSSISVCRYGFIDGIQNVTIPIITDFSSDPSGRAYLDWNYQSYAAEYLIYREVSNITDLDGLTPFATTKESYFNDFSISTNGSYYYVVVAKNGLYASNMSECLKITVNMFSVEETPILSAVYRSNEYQICLNWNYVSNANVYYIYRDLSEISDISGLAPISVIFDYNSYYDTDIFEEGTYHYVVVAGNGARNSSLSNCLNATIEFIPPIAPTLANIVPTVDIDGEIYLDWENVPFADGYYIYRCDSEVYDPANLIPIGYSGSNYYTDWVSKDQIYHYTIVAYNERGYSDLSNVVSVESLRPSIPNYAYIPTSYEWIDTSSNPIIDQEEGPSYIEINLPFAFDYYGISYSSVYVSRNGYLTFSDSAYKTAGGSDAFPTKYNGLKYVISPFLEYFSEGSTGTISTLNGSGYCAISWENMEYNGGYFTNFQVILYDDGSIKFQYDNIGDINSNNKVGLNLGDGIHGVLYTGLTTQTDDFAFMYVPYLENENPSLVLPDDLSYYSNDVKPYSLSWTITDPDVYRPIYRIFVDGEAIIDDTMWTSGNTINFDVSRWEAGQHLVMIFIEDGFGGIVVDYVWIFVEEVPIIVTAGDLKYEEDETQPQILTWTIIDSTYKWPTYNITLDGVVVVENEPWPGNKSISYDVSTLAIGNYVIELSVSDGMGNIARDAVIVSVYALSDNSPHITSPEDLTYYAGSTESYILSWTITDATVNNPTYSIEVDGTMIIENESWVSGDMIEFDVSGWEEGTYTVKITVNDGYNGEAIDVVVVTVTGTPDGSPFNLESIPGFNIIYLLGISAIAINILKKRKKYHS